jgi:hypothetical protein
MTMISGFYLQQPPCQILHLDTLFTKFLGARDYGTFVEIGANDGVSCSNTWGLAERNWSGLMVEAIPALADA